MPAADLAAAEQYTRHLAHAHYENFSVVSRPAAETPAAGLLQRLRLLPDADDLATKSATSRGRCSTWPASASRPARLYAGRADTDAVRRPWPTRSAGTTIPIEPFLDLIDAFEQDQRVSRYETFEQVVDYCRRSADPVGRLVLYMCGYRDAERQRLSDQTCTALQLANFWQDVRRDLLERDRIYLPRRFDGSGSASPKQQIRDGIAAGGCDENFRRLIRFEVERTEALFAEGGRCCRCSSRPCGGRSACSPQGGRAILRRRPPPGLRHAGPPAVAVQVAEGPAGAGRALTAALLARTWAAVGRAAGRTAHGPTDRTARIAEDRDEYEHRAPPRDVAPRVTPVRPRRALSARLLWLEQAEPRGVARLLRAPDPRRRPATSTTG